LGSRPSSRDPRVEVGHRRAVGLSAVFTR
jgi:hypothetical protein